MFKWIAKLIEKKKLNKYKKYWGDSEDIPLCIECGKPMEQAGEMWKYENPGLEGFRCVKDRFGFIRTEMILDG